MPFVCLLHIIFLMSSDFYFTVACTIFEKEATSFSGYSCYMHCGSPSHSFHPVDPSHKNLSKDFCLLDVDNSTNLFSVTRFSPFPSLNTLL